MMKHIVIITLYLILRIIPADAAPITVTDFRGKTLSFSKPPERIVCLIESALSGIYMLGAQSRIVGISANVYNESVFSDYADMDERIRQKKIPTPGNWDFVNIESVIALQPDLVLLWSHQEESIRSLEEKGIPVFGVFIKNSDDVYREILALGALTGKDARADELIRYTKQELRRFSEKTAKGNRPKIYFMWAQGELETSGKNSTVHELIELAGGVNVCGHIEQEHLVVNIENVLTWNPDLVIMWHNTAKDPKDLLQNPMWQSVNAVKARRVYEFPNAFLCDLWTLKFQYAVKMIEKWAYPQSFEHVDLEKEKLDMLKFLYGKQPK